ADAEDEEGTELFAGQRRELQDNRGWRFTHAYLPMRRIGYVTRTVYPVFAVRTTTRDLDSSFRARTYSPVSPSAKRCIKALQSPGSAGSAAAALSRLRAPLRAFL